MVIVSKGKMKYVPVDLLKALKGLKNEKRIKKDRDAFQELVKLARLGAELERLSKLNWRIEKGRIKRW